MDIIALLISKSTSINLQDTVYSALKDLEVIQAV